ncbi:MAG: hypothetical protein H0U86_08965 [Chloroflexi bacterium]|nr:hypothetical protein [Chloroflexota bacterium]
MARDEAHIEKAAGSDQHLKDQVRANLAQSEEHLGKTMTAPAAPHAGSPEESRPCAEHDQVHPHRPADADAWHASGASDIPTSRRLPSIQAGD